MNTTTIIQSKRSLEEKINALVLAYREEHGISDIEVNTRVSKYYVGSPTKEIQEVSTNATVTVHENGADIVIK